MDNEFVVAIDGPAGSGKSTVAKLVAQKAGLLYIDTGAMYRAVTLKALRQGLEMEDEDGLCRVALTAEIDLVTDQNGKSQVILDGRDVSQAIRTEELTNQVHYAARIPGVREQMVKRQRQMAVGRRIIAEGRDIGTVVFPDADRKFYLDASVQTRAQRRYKELKHKNQESDLEAIGEDIKIRDARDKGREIAPLKKAEDAVCIDTTDLTIDEVVNLIIEKLA